MAKTIIIAEDDPNVRDSLEDFLKPLLGKAGYDVQMVNNGQEALDSIREIGLPNIAAVISDCDMPFVGGVELTQAIRQQSDNLPVIIVSGNPDKIKDARKAGANGSVGKPLGKEQIEEIVCLVEREINKSSPHGSRLEKNAGQTSGRGAA